MKLWEFARVSWPQLARPLPSPLLGLSVSSSFTCCKRVSTVHGLNHASIYRWQDSRDLLLELYQRSPSSSVFPISSWGAPFADRLLPPLVAANSRPLNIIDHCLLSYLPYLQSHERF